MISTVQPVLVASLGQQLPRARRVGLHRSGSSRIPGLIGATWKFSPGVALPRKTTSTTFCTSTASLQRLPHPVVVEGLLVVLHPRHAGLRRLPPRTSCTSGSASITSSWATSTSYSPSTCLDAIAASQAEGSPPRSTNSSVRDRRRACRQWFGTAVSTAFDPIAYSVQGERPGAVAARLEHAALRRVDHHERVVEHVLRHRELRHLAVQPHGVVVDLLDRLRVPQPGRRLRFAVRRRCRRRSPPSCRAASARARRTRSPGPARA